MPDYVTLTSSKNKVLAIILCVLGFVGLSGIHRFYVGKIVSGIIYFLTAGIFGIGTIIDLIMLATNNFKDNSGAPLCQ